VRATARPTSTRWPGRPSRSAVLAWGTRQPRQTPRVRAFPLDASGEATRVAHVEPGRVPFARGPRRIRASQESRAQLNRPYGGRRFTETARSQPWATRSAVSWRAEIPHGQVFAATGRYHFCASDRRP
jgi:hypothetical protein